MRCWRTHPHLRGQFRPHVRLERRCFRSGRDASAPRSACRAMAQRRIFRIAAPPRARVITKQPSMLRTCNEARYASYPAAGSDVAVRARTLSCPMLKDNELIGAIVIYRQEVTPFTEKQIELVRTSPPRPSSPSRTRGCSTSCANRCSSRPPPPTCSRSSAARRSICERCFDTLVESAAQSVRGEHGHLISARDDGSTAGCDLRLFRRV